MSFFREFRHAFFEILVYNNSCQCFSLSTTYKIRASLSKSNHSINTKFTPQPQSRQASFTPNFIPMNQNGHCLDNFSISKQIYLSKKSESTDTFEMKTLASQRPTLEAFHELEQLVPHSIPDQVTMAEMSSLLYDQDDLILEIPVHDNSTVISNTNHS